MCNVYEKHESLIKKKNLPGWSSSLSGTIILLIHSDLLDNLNPLFPSSLLSPFSSETLFLTDSAAFSLPTSYLLDTTAGYVFLKQCLIRSYALQWLMEPGLQQVLGLKIPVSHFLHTSSLPFKASLCHQLLHDVCWNCPCGCLLVRFFAALNSSSMCILCCNFGTCMIFSWFKKKKPNNFDVFLTYKIDLPPSF